MNTNQTSSSLNFLMVSTTVREFVKMVRSHQNVEPKYRLLLVAAPLFRKTPPDVGDPNAEITTDRCIDQTLSSLGIKDEEELVMLCTGDSIDEAIVRAFDKKDDEMVQMKQQQRTTARSLDDLRHAIAVDKAMGGGSGWFKVGKDLSNGQAVEVAGKAYTKQQCYLKAIECNPQNASAWYILGTILSGAQTVEVAGKAYTKQQCYLKAIECNPQNADAW